MSRTMFINAMLTRHVDMRSSVYFGKTMKVKWTEQVQHLLKWKDIVEKAKALPEL